MILKILTLGFDDVIPEYCIIGYSYIFLQYNKKQFQDTEL